MQSKANAILPNLSLYWFRKSLRLHDNPGLLSSINSTNSKLGKNYLLPFFIMDPKFKPVELVVDRNDISSAQATFACSHNRWCFLLEALSDVDKSMRDMEVRLNVFYGEPTNTLESLFHTLTNPNDRKEFCGYEQFMKIFKQFNIRNWGP